MSPEKTVVPDDLLQLSQRLEEWRSANPPRTRLPESIWEAAVEMAQRHGLRRLLALLVRQRVVSVPVSPVATPAERLQSEFRLYLQAGTRARIDNPSVLPDVHQRVSDGAFRLRASQPRWSARRGHRRLFAARTANDGQQQMRVSCSTIAGTVCR